MDYLTIDKKLKSAKSIEEIFRNISNEGIKVFLRSPTYEPIDNSSKRPLVDLLEVFHNGKLFGYESSEHDAEGSNYFYSYIIKEAGEPHIETEPILIKKTK